MTRLKDKKFEVLVEQREILEYMRERTKQIKATSRRTIITHFSEVKKDASDTSQNHIKISEDKIDKYVPYLARLSWLVDVTPTKNPEFFKKENYERGEITYNPQEIYYIYNSPAKRELDSRELLFKTLKEISSSSLDTPIKRNIMEPFFDLMKDAMFVDVIRVGSYIGKWRETDNDMLNSLLEISTNLPTISEFSFIISQIPHHGEIMQDYLLKFPKRPFDFNPLINQLQRRYKQALRKTLS